jgi:cytochrome c peroxidase
MPLQRWIILLTLGLAVGGLRAAEVPLLPKDTLPAELDLKQVPYGLDAKRPMPLDNPLTPEKVRLGRKLFFDPILSVDRTVACASCHDPGHGFAAATPVAVGVDGRRGRRNAPSLLNRAYGSAFFWDGRAASLEEQALAPLVNGDELANPSVETVIERLRGDAEYQRAFQAAFADGMAPQNLARALASFERTLLDGHSRVDRFHAGEFAVLNEAERQGLWLFTSRGRCWKCHSGPNLSDERFHNTGVSWRKTPIDLGRFEVTRREEDRGAFKTPGLRGVARTAPYMHDGSLATLEDVAEFYNKGGGENPQRSAIIEPLNLTPADVENLVAFLKAL